MAVTDWDNLTSITRKKILPGIADAITKDNPTLFRLLKAGQTLDGGRSIQKVVFYALSGQGGWYSGLDTLKTGRETTRTRAEWNWKECHQAIVLPNIDLAKNKGTSAVFQLMGEEMEEAKRAMEDRFGTAIYTARSGDAIDSLVDGCDDGKHFAVNKFGYMLGTPKFT